MKWIKQLTKISLSAIGVVFLALSSCVSDDISIKNENQTEQTPSGPKYKQYAAFTLNASDGSGVGTNWDDYTSLDKGLPFERMIYFPTPPEEEEEDESTDSSENQLEAFDEGDNRDDGEDEENNSDPQLYNFAIIFDAEGRIKTDDLCPLELELSSDDKAKITVYSKIYTSEENPFDENFDGNVLVVLNASYDLQKSLEDKLKKIDKTSSIDNYSNFLKTYLDIKEGEEIDNFLYLKDKKGNYITDEDDHRYFTMTSSMIIDSENKLVPAIKGEFKTYPSIDEAKENPISIYIERLASKFTVVFKNGYYYHYIKRVPSNDNISAENYGISETGDKNNPIGSERLIIDQSSTTNYIRIVTDYTRSNSITQRREPDIKKTNQWRVNIIGWDINALESKENLFKNLKTGKDYSDPPATWAFNSNYPYRTLWAEDLNYDDGNYPYQSRKVIKNFYLVRNDKGEIKESEEIDASVKSLINMEASSVKPSLTFLNYQQLSNRNVSVYYPENTLSKNLMDKQIPTTAVNRNSYPYDHRLYLKTGSHLIIAAQLLINGISSSQSYACSSFDEYGLSQASGANPSEPIYYMNDIYWSEQAYKEYVAEYLAYFMQTEKNQEEKEILKTFGRNDGVFYVIDKNSQEMKPANGNYFDIVPAYVKGGDNFVYLVPNTTIYTFNPDEEEKANDSTPEDNIEKNPDDENPEARIDNDYEVPFGYHEISITDYKNLFYNHPELMAACFTAGCMYYVEGSKHNLNSPNFNNSNLSQVSTGDYGSVRNNWYFFSVDAINKPGIAVHDPEQPIVPESPQDKAIATSIQVIPWHEIFTSVDTGGQKKPGRD